MISTDILPLWSPLFPPRLSYDMYWDVLILNVCHHHLHKLLHFMNLTAWYCWAHEMLLFSKCLIKDERCLCVDCLILHYAVSHIGRKFKVIFQATVSATLLLASLFLLTFLQLPASWFSPLQQQDELLRHFRNHPINFNTLASQSTNSRVNLINQFNPKSPFFVLHINRCSWLYLTPPHLWNLVCFLLSFPDRRRHLSFLTF